MGNEQRMARNVAGHRGFALVIAIWMLVLLLILLAGFVAMTHGSSDIARNFGEMTQARWAARSAVYRGIAEIQANIATQPYTAFDGGGSTLTINSEDENIELGDAVYQTIIYDEAGKVNMNSASSSILTTLFSSDIADCMIDWRSPATSTPTPNGAEDDYYTGLSAPYHCKNAPFDTVEESLLVKGMTSDMLQTTVDANNDKMEDILTVSSVDSNTDSNGGQRVNITTATSAQLMNGPTSGTTGTTGTGTSATGTTGTSATGAGRTNTAAANNAATIFSSADAAIILRYRTNRTSPPFTSPADLLLVPNLPRADIMHAYDRLTTSTSQQLTGLVNINTAPDVVLAALPGMDESTAQAIIDYRTNSGPFTDVGQLMNVTQLSDTVFRGIANLLTARSQWYTVVGVGQTPNGVTKTITCLLKATNSGGTVTTQILNWREY